MVKNQSAGLLLAACLLLPGTGGADQYDPRLMELFLDLRRSPDAAISATIENEIWRVWSSHENPAFNSMMANGIRQMNWNQLRDALDTFSRLVEAAPDFSEAWNKRATVHYLLRNYAASKADIEQTLLLEPKHFGALSGLGLVHMAQGEYYEARNAFQSALEINPNMQGVIANLNALQDYFEDNTI